MNVSRRLVVSRETLRSLNGPGVIADLRMSGTVTCMTADCSAECTLEITRISCTPTCDSCYTCYTCYDAALLE